MKSRRIEGRKAPEAERSKNKELNELKRENHALKRKLGRLQKQVTHLLDVRGEPELDVETTPVGNLAGSRSSMPTCDECGSRDLATIDLPNGPLVICRSCKHRKKAV